MGALSIFCGPVADGILGAVRPSGTEVHADPFVDRPCTAAGGRRSRDGLAARPILREQRTGQGTGCACLLYLRGRQCARLSVDPGWRADRRSVRSEEHTSELQSLMRISYAVFCLKKKNTYTYTYEIY